MAALRSSRCWKVETGRGSGNEGKVRHKPPEIIGRGAVDGLTVLLDVLVDDGLVRDALALQLGDIELGWFGELALEHVAACDGMGAAALALQARAYAVDVLAGVLRQEGNRCQRQQYCSCGAAN